MSNILTHPPQNGEVWTVDDTEVRLHADNREDKVARPVVILMSPRQDISRLKLANVAPLSSSAEPDAITIPIARGFEKTADGYQPDSSCCAVLLFYQPIETRFFRKYKGRLDAETQIALKTILQSEIIGIPDFDFEL
jgi:mRNA-degrading endonuclease toxin of MazEF toxin-antitoxin module